MAKPQAYLDYAATTPLKPEVIRRMGEVLAMHGNASSVHAYGRAAREQLETARAALAVRYKVKADRVIFTSSATEANNMALRAHAFIPMLASGTEHPSILVTAQTIARPLHLVRAGQNGVIDLNHLEEVFKTITSPALLSLMLVNNETGVIQPVAEAAKLARRFGAVVHCDAVQGAGRMPIDFSALGVDMLSLSAHKLGGPQGAGALLLHEGLRLPALLTGGAQEFRQRAGTENVAAIAGFGCAVELLDADLARQEEWAGWRTRFEQRITAAAPNALVIGRDAPRVAGIANIVMPGVRNDTQLMAFDLAGLAVSSGSACSSGKVQPSAVLSAMGYEEGVALNAIRVSFGWNSGEAELENLAEKWIELYQRASNTRAA